MILCKFEYINAFGICLHSDGVIREDGGGREGSKN